MVASASGEDPIESIVLRESVRARVTVAPISIIGTFASIALFLPFLLDQGVSATRIALWVSPIVLLTLARTLYSRRINSRFEDISMRELNTVDTRLRLSSIANQFFVGTGIWVIQSPDADPYVLPLFMTLTVLIFCVGVMANLFSDFLSFALSIPLLIGQPAIYWLTRDEIGLAIGIGMLLATSLMILLIKRGSAIFRDSVLMRFEKDALLARIEEEKERTVLALEEAEEANKSKTFFMAAASHDIKQPLSTLGMLTESLLRSDVPEQVQSILKLVRGNIAMMSRHFDALMDMSRFEGGAFRVELGPLRLCDLSARINEEFEPRCINKGLKWHIQMDDVEIETDTELLVRVFRNLLSNAVRYTPAGEIRCRGIAFEDRVEFTVSDTGPGIPASEQTHVFKQFVRLEDSGQDVNGAGLGLTIVHHIDSALNLGIKMESSEGKGTSFSFTIKR